VPAGISAWKPLGLQPHVFPAQNPAVLPGAVDLVQRGVGDGWPAAKQGLEDAQPGSIDCPRKIIIR